MLLLISKNIALVLLEKFQLEHERSFGGKLQSCCLEAALGIVKIKALNEGKAYLSDQILA